MMQLLIHRFAGSISYHEKLSVIVVVVLLALSTTPMTAQIASEPDLVLRWEHSECLRDKADRYLDTFDAVVLLYVGFCDDDNFNPSASEISKESTQNAFVNSTINIPDARSVPDQGKLAVIVLTRAQLICMRDRFAEIADRKKFQLFDGTKTDVAEISFDKCN